MAVVSSQDGRILRSHPSFTGQAFTLTCPSGYTMSCVLPISPMLTAAMELEADKAHTVRVLVWLLSGSRLSKKTIPVRT